MASNGCGGGQIRGHGLLLGGRPLASPSSLLHVEAPCGGGCECMRMESPSDGPLPQPAGAGRSKFCLIRTPSPYTHMVPAAYSRPSQHAFPFLPPSAFRRGGRLGVRTPNRQTPLRFARARCCAQRGSPPACRPPEFDSSQARTRDSHANAAAAAASNRSSSSVVGGPSASGGAGGGADRSWSSSSTPTPTPYPKAHQ